MAVFEAFLHGTFPGSIWKHTWDDYLETWEEENLKICVSHKFSQNLKKAKALSGITLIRLPETEESLFQKLKKEGLVTNLNVQRCAEEYSAQIYKIPQQYFFPLYQRIGIMHMCLSDRVQALQEWYISSIS